MTILEAPRDRRQVLSEQQRRRADERRVLRYGLLSFLQANSPQKAHRTCMTPLGADVVVGLSVDGHVHSKGVARCGSVHSCPVCSPTIRERRAQEIDRAITTHLSLPGGRSAVMVTPTIPHLRVHRLAELLDVFGAAWASLMRSRRVRTLLASRSFAGSMYCPDATHGLNGWHPHRHQVLLFDAAMSDAERSQFASELSAAWRHEVTRRGWAEPHEVYGMDVQPVRAGATMPDGMTAGTYVTKAGGDWGAGRELVRSDIKRGGGGLSPWELLELAAVEGDAAALRLWLEYETAMHGRKAVQWSKGLKARLGVDEVSDEELAEQAADEPMVVEVTISAEQWWKYRRRYRLGELIGQAVAELRRQVDEMERNARHDE